MKGLWSDVRPEVIFHDVLFDSTCDEKLMSSEVGLVVESYKCYGGCVRVAVVGQVLSVL